MVNDYHGFSLLLCSSRKTISSPFYKKESIIMLILRRYYIDLKKSVSNQFKESILTQLSFIMLSRELYATPRYKTHKKSELTFFRDSLKQVSLILQHFGQ